MKKFLSLLLVMTLLCGVVGCGRESDDSSYSENYYRETEEKAFTSAEAISQVKTHSLKRIEEAIAEYHKLKFYYSPDYGSFSAARSGKIGERNNENIWVVTVKGNISGYTDDYKTNFKSGLQFTVRITANKDSYPWVWPIEVSWY